MPIYTYRCESCGVQFERQQSFKDQPLTRCPECNKKSLRKVFTPVGIVFKGSGWYATDNKSPSGGSHTTKTESKDASSSGPSDSSSSTSKSADSNSTSSSSTSGDLSK